MKHYFPGQRIRVRGEEWQVEAAREHRVMHGGSVWEIEAKGLTNIVLGTKYVFLDDIDTIEAVDPSLIEPEISTSGRAIKAKLFWEAHLRRLLPRNGAIYLGQHGACHPYEYQMQPAFKALNLMRPRILIGDSVGLGKTIECGILLTELIRRGRGKRILCAVPKATLEQFQTEMWGRFAIPFQRLDSRGLEKLRQELPSTMNPFYHYDKAIISIDTLKLKKYQLLLENCDWDVLVIDECHNVADRTDGAGGSARHHVARRLAEKANAVILMSATPHDGTKAGFASLIKLLDRTRISSDLDFKPEDFNKHFIRRTRSDVASQIENRAPRKQLLQKIPLSDAEINILHMIHDGDAQTKLLSKKTNQGQKELFKTTLIKSFLSSPQALLETVKKKLKNIDSSSTKTDEDTLGLLTLLKKIESAITTLPTFSRLKYLKEYIQSHPTNTNDRLVIFTERLKTMDEIKDFLIKEKLVDAEFDIKNEKEQPKGKLIASAQGSMTDIELPTLVKAFQSANNGLEILIATNVASEGLNLHNNCHRLIHFDLPWSLITLEQRNGRIDRLGQNKTPEIFYFASTVEKSSSSHTKNLKDDLWIVNKIEKRIHTAAHDMAEEALSKFNEATEEEVKNTQNFEAGKIDEEADVDSFFAMLANPEVTDEIAPKTAPQKRKLPTLFEKSPSDFVVNLAREAKLDAKSIDADLVAIKMNASLKFEVNQWPSDYRPDPDSDEIILDANISRMQKNYEKSTKQGVELNTSFMNEIHPIMTLLENTAMSFFPGSKVPTVTLKGENKDTVYFLIQSSLFNRRNDIVDQFWQILEHKKGSPNLKAFVDMTEYEHAIGISNWLNERLKDIKQKPELATNEKRRILDLTKKAIETMKSLTVDCRKKRGDRLRTELSAELSRIKKWEDGREKYLKNLLAIEKENRSSGLFSLQSRAIKEELEKIHADSQNYKLFVEEYLATSDEPDIKILGCLVVEE